MQLLIFWTDESTHSFTPTQALNRNDHWQKINGVYICKHLVTSKNKRTTHNGKEKLKKVMETVFFMIRKVFVEHLVRKQRFLWSILDFFGHYFLHRKTWLQGHRLGFDQLRSGCLGASVSYNVQKTPKIMYDNVTWQSIKDAGQTPKKSKFVSKSVTVYN